MTPRLQEVRTCLRMCGSFGKQQATSGYNLKRQRFSLFPEPNLFRVSPDMSPEVDNAEALLVVLTDTLLTLNNTLQH